MLNFKPSFDSNFLRQIEMIRLFRVEHRSSRFSWKSGIEHAINLWTSRFTWIQVNWTWRISTCSNLAWDSTWLEASQAAGHQDQLQQRKKETNRLVLPVAGKSRPPVEACPLQSRVSARSLQSRAELQSSCPTPIEWAQLSEILPKLGLLSRLSFDELAITCIQIQI